MMVKVSLKELKDEINQIRQTHRKLKDDEAFVFWFTQASVADSENDALNALTGHSGDKNIDAILIDDKVRQIHIIQGKFRQSKNHNEKRNDVLSFADLGTYPWEEKRTLDSFYKKLDPLVKDRFEDLVKKVRDSNYALKMYYITTGRCSKQIINEAMSRVRQAEEPVDFFFLGNHEILTTFKDYLEGVAPAVPILPLKILSDGPVQSSGIINRMDPQKDIESWVFSMSAKDVGEMYKKTGIRLFARNIRGYLGDTEINLAMAETIKKEPENFWYYNNGVTIVCDNVRRETQGGQDILFVDRPQVINGQQTTRTLNDSSPANGSVLVKVIKIPRHPGDDEEYDNLVNSIVRATNWQNHIDASDLISNDSIQVFIERALRKVGYQYIRKKMKKSEAKRLFSSHAYYQIDKRELAQAVAATIFDPVIVRKGREGLFEDPYYKSVFSSRSVSYYLSRYWLMKGVQYGAKGKPNRAYPKWLVLKFCWKLLSPYISNVEDERRFRYINENNESLLRLLDKVIDGVFKSSLAFFLAERGSGQEAKDISTFFLLSKLDQKFEKFWRSKKNHYRGRVTKAITRFQNKLKKFEIPE